MRNKTVAALVLGFIVVSVLLTVFGLIDIKPEEVLGYSFIILGLSLVYPAFKANQKLIIFVGSAIFLTGIAVIIFSSFELIASTKFITPLLLIIGGISLLIVYLSETIKKLFLIISVVTITSGVVLIYFQKPASVSIFLDSILPVFESIWPAFLILIVIIILVRRTD
ncbi:MAG TPA: hypothetical protein VH917_01055 [Ignavibacteriaceae bacterium]